jgi:hypothetical protein
MRNSTDYGKVDIAALYDRVLSRTEAFCRELEAIHYGWPQAKSFEDRERWFEELKGLLAFFPEGKKNDEVISAIQQVRRYNKSHLFKMAQGELESLCVEMLNLETLLIQGACGAALCRVRGDLTSFNGQWVTQGTIDNRGEAVI